MNSTPRELLCVSGEHIVSEQRCTCHLSEKEAIMRHYYYYQRLWQNGELTEKDREQWIQAEINLKKKRESIFR